VFSARREVPGPYKSEFRILHEDAVRWIPARGRGEDEGIVGRLMFGVLLDVTERKLAEDGREMLAREMSHRVKNLLAIAGALTKISARGAATPKDMAADVSRRLIPLGKAHELVRSLSEQNKAASLGDLLGLLLGAYDERGVVGDCIRLSVPDLLVDEAAITPLALIIHELATNSVKYGALSQVSGLLEIICAADDRKVILGGAKRVGRLLGPRVVSRASAPGS
jgi:hypothetical protein